MRGGISKSKLKSKLVAGEISSPSSSNDSVEVEDDDDDEDEVYSL